jgi:hypothetical protein
MLRVTSVNVGVEVFLRRFPHVHSEATAKVVPDVVFNRLRRGIAVDQDEKSSVCRQFAGLLSARQPTGQKRTQQPLESIS